MEMILEFLKPFIAFVVAKVPLIGIVAANGVAALAVVGLLIEGVEAVSALTASKKDDEAAAKIKAIKDKVLVVLEIIPHMNIPVVAGIGKLAKVVRKIVAIVKGAIAGSKEE